MLTMMNKIDNIRYYVGSSVIDVIWDSVWGSVRNSVRNSILSSVVVSTKKSILKNDK